MIGMRSGDCTNGTATSSKPSFLSLPWEVRQECYKQIAYSQLESRSNEAWRCFDYTVPMALLVVNRAVSSEAICYVFSVNKAITINPEEFDLETILQHPYRSLIQEWRLAIWLYSTSSRVKGAEPEIFYGHQFSWDCHKKCLSQLAAINSLASLNVIVAYSYHERKALGNEPPAFKDLLAPLHGRVDRVRLTFCESMAEFFPTAFPGRCKEPVKDMVKQLQRQRPGERKMIEEEVRQEICYAGAMREFRTLVWRD